MMYQSSRKGDDALVVSAVGGIALVRDFVPPLLRQYVTQHDKIILEYIVQVRELAVPLQIVQYLPVYATVSWLLT